MKKSSAAISEKVRRRILAQLNDIERAQHVKILYACESGSRAWGFASNNSDYDVRFIYIHPCDWYLSIDADQQPDTIELPLKDEVDLAGWDLQKALKLLYKSNPSLIEWLGSPIQYRESVATGGMQRLLKSYFAPVACGWHYLNMARANYRDYLDREVVQRKKYFYVLRPLLAFKWVTQMKSPAPMAFSRLTERFITNSRLRKTIAELLALKVAGKETDQGPRIPELDHFIARELRDAQNPTAPEIARQSREPLNRFFRSCLVKS